MLWSRVMLPGLRLISYGNADRLNLFGRSNRPPRLFSGILRFSENIGLRSVPREWPQMQVLKGFHLRLRPPPRPSAHGFDLCPKFRTSLRVVTHSPCEPSCGGGEFDHPIRKVGLRLGSDGDSSNERRTSRKWEAVKLKPRGSFSLLQIVHRHGLAAVPILVRVGWWRARPTSGGLTRAIPYDR